MKNPDTTAPESVRDYMRRIGKAGGAKSWQVRSEKLTDEEKKAHAARMRDARRTKKPPASK